MKETTQKITFPKVLKLKFFLCKLGFHDKWEATGIRLVSLNIFPRTLEGKRRCLCCERIEVATYLETDLDKSRDTFELNWGESMKKAKDTTIDLCSNCTVGLYPDCMHNGTMEEGVNFEFGNGVGNDNVKSCNFYEGDIELVIE